MIYSSFKEKIKFHWDWGSKTDEKWSSWKFGFATNSSVQCIAIRCNENKKMFLEQKYGIMQASFNSQYYTVMTQPEQFILMHFVGKADQQHLFRHQYISGCRGSFDIFILSPDVTLYTLFSSDICSSQIIRCRFYMVSITLFWKRR